MDTFINQFNIEEFPTLSVERVEDLKAHIKETKYKTLRVLHNNIRSAGKNLDEFKVMLKQIDVNIDVLVFSETWDIKDIVYRPPSMKIDDFTTALDTLLDNCQQRGKFDVVLLVGDVNIDILARSIDALNYLNILSENNFSP
ncbi:hypothetical protein WA026_007853 [Henosepilachna vigintioctopunctata]|uniref:NYN domain-containing protein n=1 Tax=Henosepilachna vigintioctopunctata TaxID=420089 RepID=A0AAW1U3A7_9CUCU